MEEHTSPCRCLKTWEIIWVK